MFKWNQNKVCICEICYMHLLFRMIWNRKLYHQCF